MYRIYGLHSCMNVVAAPEERPEAILVEPPCRERWASCPKPGKKAMAACPDQRCVAPGIGRIRRRRRSHQERPSRRIHARRHKSRSWQSLAGVRPDCRLAQPRWCQRAGTAQRRGARPGMCCCWRGRVLKGIFRTGLLRGAVAGAGQGRVPARRGTRQQSRIWAAFACLGLCGHVRELAGAVSSVVWRAGIAGVLHDPGRGMQLVQRCAGIGFTGTARPAVRAEPGLRPPPKLARRRRPAAVAACPGERVMPPEGCQGA